MSGPIKVRVIRKPVIKAKMLSQWPARVAVGVVTTGEAGTSATVENVGTAGSAVLNFMIPRGAKGDMGPQGQKGDQGEQGPQGIQGPKGDPGDIGATGPAGAQGPQGIKGDAGSTGAQGPKGDKGDKGDTGDTGPEGPAGPKGDQGPAGAGTGDMLAATYDPNGKATDAFNQDNMVDGTTNKNYTAAEKSKLAGIAAGATANTGTVTSVSASVPTGLSVSGGPITGSGTLALAWAAGYQGYTSAEATKLSGVAANATANVGTVTSVGASVPTGLSVSGGPVTASGTLAFTWTAGYQGYTSAEASKLAGIAAGAEVNVNADWAASSGDAQILNKPSLREVLTADRTYYVRTDGSDGNSGLANTSGGAFVTIQKAIDVALGTLDFFGNTVTIQVADGTYSVGGRIGPGVGVTAAAKFVIKGNNTTPGNVIVSVTASDAFAAESGGLVTIKDMELRTTTSGSCLSALTSGHIEFANIRFGSAGEHHILSRTLGKIIAVGNYAIVGGGQCHMRVISGTIRTSSRTITLSGTPSFSSAFAYAEYLGLIDAFGITFSGSATGKRYDVSTNGVVRTNGAGSTYFPGNSNGSTATGGQYV